MMTETTTTSTTAFTTKVLAPVLIAGIGGLTAFALSLFIFSSQSRPEPYQPSDLTYVGTNVRTRPFGVFDLPPDQWGNRSPLLLERMNRGAQASLLGTVEVGRGWGHGYDDGGAADTAAIGPLAVRIGSGDGVESSQHLTVFDEQGVSVLCLPPGDAGATYYFDTRGNPYADKRLSQRKLPFDCQDRTALAMSPDALADGDAVNIPFYDPAAGQNFVAFARASIGPWSDLGCLTTDLAWNEGSSCVLNQYPPPPFGRSPLVAAPHTPSEAVTYAPNIYLLWNDVGKLHHVCVPALSVENASEMVYVAEDGSTYVDPFLTDPLLPSSCEEIRGRGFKPDDVLDVAVDPSPPGRGSIAVTRGRLMLRPEEGEPFPYFGQIDSEGDWNDKGLGGSGSPAPVGDTPLFIALQNPESEPLTFPETSFELETDAGKVHVCLPETIVRGGGQMPIKAFFVDSEYRVFHDPLLLDPAPCSQG